jgi:hypothetical protein
MPPENNFGRAEARITARTSGSRPILSNVSPKFSQNSLEKAFTGFLEVDFIYRAVLHWLAHTCSAPPEECEVQEMKPSQICCLSVHSSPYLAAIWNGWLTERNDSLLN